MWKGSGFGKILDAYEFQVNYKEDKKPSFRSDRASFFTIMPNLNYDIKGVPQGVPQEGIDDRIISLIRENKDITTEEIASILNVSSKTIKRHIEKMPNVKYVGSGYSGHWEITD